MVYEGLIMAGALFGALGAAGAGVLGSFISYNQRKKLMDRQAKLNYDYSIKSAKNMPSANRSGLESAGYNPMLAVQNATSGANASWTSSQSVDSPDISGAISEGVANAQSFQRLRNETEQAESTVNLQNQQAFTEESKRKNYEFQNAMLDVEKHLKEKDLDNYDRRFYSELYEQMQRAENYRAMANVQGYNAETARISANAQKVTAEQGTLPRYLINKGESVYSSLGRPKTPRELGVGIANYYYRRNKR